MPRAIRVCDACGGVDDHPHHQHYSPDAGFVPSDEFLDSLGPVPAGAVARLLNPHTTDRHHDCCAALGCKQCIETELANGGRRGQDLIDHLESLRGA